MFTCELDERLGLMVGRHHAGNDPSTFPDIMRAERRFVACTGVPGFPKVELLFVDDGASHPGAREREQLAEAWKTRNGKALFALVTTSRIMRAAFAVISLLNGRDRHERARRAFATQEDALSWIETVRPGVRADLLRINARRIANHEASLPRSATPSRPMPRPHA